MLSTLRLSVANLSQLSFKHKKMVTFLVNWSPGLTPTRRPGRTVYHYQFDQSRRC